MTDDRSLERAARSWLEEGPTQAPDRPVEAALARIQTLTQERDLRIPWRPRTMFDRLAAAAAVAVVAIGGITLGYSLITRPNEPAAGPCPAQMDEVNAVDTFVPGLTQTQRAWGIAGGQPGRVRSGSIALFAYDPENAPLSVVTIDPATGETCRLIRFLQNGQIGDISSLDWSPAGDALAIGFRRLVATDQGLIEGDGQVLVWTTDRLFRVWSGLAYPRLEWAPDGRSMLIWSSDGTMGADGRPTIFDTRLLFADGSPDRTFNVFPVDDSLRWSPDGSQWVVAEATEADINPDTAVSLVEVPDGRLTPLDVGTGHFRPIGWTDHDSVILAPSERRRGVTGYLDVPIADPRSLRVLLGPQERLSFYGYLSPDGARLLYLDGMDESANGGDISLIETSGVGGDPVRLAPGMKAGSAGFAWSPDGSQVVFHAIAGGVWTVNVDGSGLRQIARGDMSAVDSPWQPVPVR